MVVDVCHSFHKDDEKRVKQVMHPDVVGLDWLEVDILISSLVENIKKS
jgi:hypothetical protein